MHDDTLPTKLPTAGTTFGHYRVLRELGRGGMGVVLLARHTVLDRVDAVKVLHPKLAAARGVGARLMVEARAMSRIAHPNVVRVHDAGVINGVPYLAMEHLPGNTVRVELTRSGVIRLDRAVDLLLAASAAVSAAHRAGVVHRDLKPSNLFVVNGADGVEVVKVLDFGLARIGRAARPGEELTLPGDRVGTPGYIAPELLDDPRLADDRSDQYALGVTLATCVLGAVKDPNSDISARVLVAPTLPDGLRAALLRSLDDDPGARFPSVRAFATALLPFASEGARARWRSELCDDELQTAVMPPRPRPRPPPPPPAPPSETLLPAVERTITEPHVMSTVGLHAPRSRAVRWMIAVAGLAALVGAAATRVARAAAGDVVVTRSVVAVAKDVHRCPPKAVPAPPRPPAPVVSTPPAPSPPRVAAHPAPRPRALILPDELP
jgi:serine/threonine protein kinase